MQEYIKCSSIYNVQVCTSSILTQDDRKYLNCTEISEKNITPPTSTVAASHSPKRKAEEKAKLYILVTFFKYKIPLSDSTV